MILPSRDYERDLPGRIAQIDEVGRGALCGPVCAAAVILPDTLAEGLAGIRDSKKVARRKREVLAGTIRATCAWGIGTASAAEIDAIGILPATFLAMVRAVAALPVRPDAVLVDGTAIPPELDLPGRAVVDGDVLCTGIAAASIIAKVHRDAIMRELAAEFPGFGWAENVGYGAPEHLKGLTRHGHTRHHRKSFRGVRGTPPYVAPLF